MDSALNFQYATPRGLIRFLTVALAAITHFLGILDSVQNCQYATPRGLIHLITVGCNNSLFGAFRIQFQIVNMLDLDTSLDTVSLGRLLSFDLNVLLLV